MKEPDVTCEEFFLPFGLRMPKIWLANVEEVFLPRHPDDDWTLIPKTDAMAPRFLLYAEPGDVMLLSCEVPRSFVRYVAQVNGFHHEPLRVMAPACPVSPYSLVDSVLDDPQLMEALRKLICIGSWHLDAYIETPGVFKLAEALGIPAGSTPRDIVLSGVVNRINDKVYFKELCRRLGIEVVPGYECSSREEIESALKNLRQNYPDHFMMRKAMSGGGLGNLSGAYDELMFLLPDYYQGGQVVVEPMLDLSATLGTLVRVEDGGCRFIGIDQQMIEDSGWVGFRYPWSEVPLSSTLEELSMRIASEAHQMGVRGYLNLDWGLAASTNGPKILALESNFRHNGLSHLLDFSHRYFGAAESSLHIVLRETFTLPGADLTWEQLVHRLESVRYEDAPLLISGPGRECGVIPVLPPVNHTCGLAVFGRSAEEADSLLKKVYAALV